MTIWTITDGRIGFVNQAEGLAQALSEQLQSQWFDCTVKQHRLLKLMPTRLAAFFKLFDIVQQPEGNPDIIICCGSQSHAAALWLAKQCGAFSICVQRPPSNKFDLIVAPQHDYSHAETAKLKSDKVMLTLGAVGKINQQMKLEQSDHELIETFGAMNQPLIGVLIGGSNKAYELKQEQILAQLDSIRRLSKGTLLITPSRRTDATVWKALQEAFSHEHYVWDGESANPLKAILHCAVTIAVTSDSINLVSEACSTGKPVYLLPLTEKRLMNPRPIEKFTRFHQTMIKQQYLQRFDDKWEPKSKKVLDETKRIAKDIAKLVRNNNSKTNATTNHKIQ